MDSVNPPQTPRSTRRPKKSTQPNDQRRSSHQQSSDWDPAQPADTDGAFDANGNFVLSSQPSQAQPHAKKPKSRGMPKAAQAPEWDEQHAQTIAEEGHFDANGTFVAPQNAHPNTQHPKKKPRPAKKSRQSSDQADGNYSDHPGTHALPINGSSTPPWTGKTPSKAYAGATFQNSPAASALPIPKFAQARAFSQSLPNNATSQPSLAARLEQEENQQELSQNDDQSSSSNSPTPQTRRPQPATANRDSPLDFLFKADHAEKINPSSNSPSLVHAVVNQPQQSQGLRGAQQTPGGHWASIYSGHSRARSQDISRFAGGVNGAPWQDYSQPPPLPTNHNYPIHGTTPSKNSREQLGQLRGMGARSVTAPSTVPQTLHENVPSPPPFAHTPSPPVYNAHNYGQTTPVYPTEMEGSPVNHHQYHPPGDGSPFSRSAGSSPLPQPLQTTAEQPLHYGNRNLSPMFKASKMDINRRPSNLRQELSPSSPSTSNLTFGSNQFSARSSDTSTSALHYLNTQIPVDSIKTPLDTPTKAKPTTAIASGSSHARKKTPASMPKSFSEGATDLLSNIYGKGSTSGSYVDPIAAAKAKASQPRAGTGNADTKSSMEDDLKRLLNLSGGSR